MLYLRSKGCARQKLPPRKLRLFATAPYPLYDNRSRDKLPRPSSRLHSSFACTTSPDVGNSDGSCATPGGCRFRLSGFLGPRTRSLGIRLRNGKDCVFDRQRPGIQPSVLGRNWAYGDDHSSFPVSDELRFLVVWSLYQGSGVSGS